ncbi:hypothetical protein QQ045_017857 [Rhodiola kirilowii]
MWEHSNRLSVMIIHCGIPEVFREYSQFRISYNCQREKWTLNELISLCVEEEEMLKHDKTANSKAPVFCTNTTCHLCE